MPYWGIFPLSIEIYRFSLLRDHPHLPDTYQVDDLALFCHDPPVDLTLSRFIRLTPSDVSVIFVWSHLGLIDSHIIISSECMSDLLCIPMELLMSHQDISGTFDATLGHIPSFSYGDDCSLTDLLQFSSFDREMSYLLHGSLFRWFSSRWAFIRT